jgi:DNA-binding transcriptional MerR regulator
MLPDPDGLDIIALADATGVTPRTIRYYVQQGLLPSPNKRGPGANYDKGLVDRLQLIKRLQRQHLPLAEIRNQLESLDDNGVREALGGLPELSLPDSSVAYVRSVLSREPYGSASAPGPLFSGKPEEADALMLPKTATTKSTWERVRLSRDVELHVRRPLTRERNKLVDRLLDAAKNIFAEEP